MTSIGDNIRNHAGGAGTLLDALDAVRNGRAVLTLALTVVAFALVTVVLGAISGWLASGSGTVGALLALLSVLISAAILLIGTTATGFMLSDDVWGREPRAIAAALDAAAGAAHRVVILIGLAIGVLLAYLLVLALVFFVCKIPVIGPILYAAAFPLGAIITGVLVFSLFYVLLPLAAPCIWNGDDVTRAIATLREVLRQRPGHVFIMFLLLALLVLAASTIVGIVLFSGIGLTISLSIAVVGVGSGFDAGSMLMGHTGVGTGHAVAFGLGMLVLGLTAGIPLALIGMKGAAIIHKGAISGLAIGDAAADLDRQVDQIKRRVQRPAKPAPEARPAVAPRALVCPNAECGAPIGEDDLFCTECGERLK